MKREPTYIIDLHPAKLRDAFVADIEDENGKPRQCLIIPTIENGIMIRKGFWRWRFKAFANDRGAKPFYFCPNLPKESLAYLTDKGLIEKGETGVNIVGGIWKAKNVKK